MRRTERALELAGALVVSLLLVMGTGQAHQVLEPRADHLRVSPARIRLEMRYDIEAGPAAEELRALYDRDRSGYLDLVERASLLSYLELATTHFLRLRVDGQALALRVTDRRGGPFQIRLPSPRAINATFALEASLPPWPAAGPRSLELEDRAKDSRYPVLLSVAPEGGCELVSGTVYPRGSSDARRSLLLPLRAGEPVLRGIRLEKGERLELKLERR